MRVLPSDPPADATVAGYSQWLVALPFPNRTVGRLRLASGRNADRCGRSHGWRALFDVPLGCHPERNELRSQASSGVAVSRSPEQNALPSVAPFPRAWRSGVFHTDLPGKRKDTQALRVSWRDRAKVCTD
jgi:hypothetical protein